MVFKANSKSGLRWARVLMTASMLLLLCFVCYWLNSQYHDEKQSLQKELLTDLTNTHKGIADSLLFERYIGPALSPADSDNAIRRVLKKDISLPDSPFFIYSTYSGVQSQDSLKEALQKMSVHDKQILQARIKIKTGEPTDTERHTVFIAAEDSSAFAHARKEMIFMQSGQVADSPILKLVTTLLTTAIKQTLKDSAGRINMEMQPADIAIIHEQFRKELNWKSKSFKPVWLNDSTVLDKKNDKQIVVAYNIYENKGKLAITGYEGYLFQKILPQSLFGLLLVGMVQMAFIISYRNLQRQMRLTEIKNGLISNMSHELKTPVATVKVALEALDDYNIINNPVQAREYIQMAKHETTRLEMLINKALHTSLLEQGKITLQREATDIAALTKEIVQSLKLRVQQNNTEITLHTEGENFILNIDKLHVQGAILNIIDNSIKYCNSPVQIHIDIIAHNATITMNITDNGPGIPDEYREQVFEKFFRVPTGDRHNIQGYGLGLSYVKQVMQLHDGVATVQNMPESGCRFTLQFFRGR